MKLDISNLNLAMVIKNIVKEIMLSFKKDLKLILFFSNNIGNTALGAFVMVCPEMKNAENK